MMESVEVNVKVGTLTYRQTHTLMEIDILHLDRLALACGRCKREKGKNVKKKKNTTKGTYTMINTHRIVFHMYGERASVRLRRNGEAILCGVT